MGKCYNSVVVPAPVDRVWQRISNFHDLTWAPNVVDKVEVVGDLAGNQVGARRVLNNAFHETLLAVNNLDRSFQYSIDDGPGPVSRDAVRNYIGTVRVYPITSNNTTFVEWISRYDSPDDSAVGELCNPIYQALLGDLASAFS